MRQKFGQHFLRDSKLLGVIADAADIQERDTIIEIGPGHGELTSFLVERLLRFSHTRIFLLERDITLIPELQTLFAPLIAEGRLVIVVGDALYELPRLVESEKLEHFSYKLVGNIPYYITGALFRVIEELEAKPALTVFTIQKEVALRIASEPPHMNLLAASVQFWADATVVATLPRTLFTPPPDVDSAVVKLTTHTANPTQKERDSYYQFIKLLFKQPRKTIMNNLRSIPSVTKRSEDELKKLFESIHCSPNDRPQHMHINAIKQLAFLLYNE